MLYQAIYLFIVALVLAFLEVQIEGKHGWAAKLPTWRKSDSWYAKLWGVFMSGKEMTGYHLGMFGSWVLILHYPFFAGTAWSWGAEAWVLSIFCLFAAMQDYLWIIINPYYGVIKRRPKDDVWWHKHWIGPFPTDYYIGTIISLAIISPLWWQNFSILKDWVIMYAVFVGGIVITLILVEIFRGDVDPDIKRQK